MINSGSKLGEKDDQFPGRHLKLERGMLVFEPVCTNRLALICSSLSLNSVTLQQLEIGCGGSIYTMEI